MKKNEVKPCIGIVAALEQASKDKDFIGYDVEELADILDTSIESARTRANKLARAGKLHRETWIRKRDGHKINVYSLPGGSHKN